MKKIDLGDGKTVEMREPKVRDMLAVKHFDNDMDREVALIGNLTELTVDEISELPWAKYQELQEAYMGFQPTKSNI